MIFLLVRKFSRVGSASVLAPAIFLTCPLVLTIGHINLLDSLLSMLLGGPFQRSAQDTVDSHNNGSCDRFALGADDSFS